MLLAAGNEKFPAYEYGLTAGVKNQLGDNKTATLCPRRSEPNAPSFCKTFNEVVAALPTGHT